MKTQTSPGCVRICTPPTYCNPPQTEGGEKCGLDPREITFAHMLRDAGYSTAVVGKWQLYNNRFEDLRGMLPEQSGFDEYLLWHVKVEDKGRRYWGPLLNHNGEMKQHPRSVFGPDVFNNFVLDYIRNHKSQPFFIYYPMVLAHTPLVTTPEMRDEAASDQDKFAAMMAYMDKMVGNVRAVVEAAGIAENTVIFFIGDNGTSQSISSRQHGVEVRGAKGETITHGTRVPFLAWGPRLVESRLVSTSLVNLNDILPTLADLAGVSPPTAYPGDGLSLAPVLRGQSELDRESIFIHYDPRWQCCMPARYAFDHRWKLYESGEFYDMDTDRLELNALNVGELGEEGGVAYQMLYERINSMPGELSSAWRWRPPQFYVRLGLALLGLFVFGWISWFGIAWLRRRENKP